MKVYRETKQPKFVPIVITLETEEEALLLCHALLRHESVPLRYCETYDLSIEEFNSFRKKLLLLVEKETKPVGRR